MKCTQRHILQTTLASIRADVFSSHEFIRKLMVLFSDEYVTDLVKLFDRGTKRPLTTLHGTIGKALTTLEGRGIERVRRERSRNLLGRTTSNQMWKKIEP